MPVLEKIEDPSTSTLFIDVPSDDVFYKAYKVAEKAFWIPEEFENALEKDKPMFPGLDTGIKHLVKNVIGFFLIGDGLINDSIQNNIDSRIQPRVLKLFYDFQKAMENIHNKSYAKLADTYVTNPEERKKMFDTLNNFPSIRRKVEWVRDQLHSNEFHKLSPETLDMLKTLKNNYVKITDTVKAEIPANLQKIFAEMETERPLLAHQLLVNLIVEGIFFSASFCVIYWLNDNGILPGLCKLNEFIARDEGMHCDFACLVYRLLIDNKLTETAIHELFAEAIAVEDDFIDDAIHADLLGLSSKSMQQYVRFVADNLLVKLGYNKLFKVNNPFDFINKLNISVRITDFFQDNDVTEYAIARSGAKPEEQELYDSGSDLSDFD